MPADPSVDLAALDALFAAATHIARIDDPEHGLTVSDIAPLRAALDALDLPALRRRLEIGDAAVEVCDAEAAYSAADAALDAVMSDYGGFAWKQAENGEDDAASRLDAARAKLRALREAQNG